MKQSKDAAEMQLADDLWFIEKARARGEINASEYATLQNEAYAKRSGAQP
jgi:hypothetical protein